MNLVDSDHGWNGSVVRVSGPWETTSRSGHGLIPLSWNIDSIFQVTKLIAEEAKARALKLYEILYNKRNWSWLLNPNRLAEPLAIPRPMGMVQEDMASMSDNDR